MAVVVKVCGITNEADALAVAGAGADALGFVFYERSPRGISIEIAAAIASRIPPHLVRTGVFVDAPPEQVFLAVRECQLTLLQFHGTESPEYCAQFGVMSMKAFRVRGRGTIEEMRLYSTDALLLDAWTPGQLGGTGERFDWELATEAKALGKPIFLAGGLTVENVAQAVGRVRPFGVDVSSGVESVPGRKDHLKIGAFVRAAKSVDCGLDVVPGESSKFN